MEASAPVSGGSDSDFRGDLPPPEEPLPVLGGENSQLGEEVAHSEKDLVDELPEELDVSGYVGPYVFPNNSRRRMPGVIYLFSGVVLIAGWGITLSFDVPWVNVGYLIAGAALLALGGYHFLAGKDLKVDERAALMAAVKEVGFPVGHASAQMGWRGWGSRPTWRILVFSNEPQPAQRGLVLIDGMDGTVLESIVEENPEDWSELCQSELSDVDGDS